MCFTCTKILQRLTEGATHEVCYVFNLLEGKIALITGSGAGNGRSLAIGLARWGAKIIVTDIDPEAAAETAILIRKEGFDAWSYPMDVTNIHSAKALAGAISAEHGDVDILINNAGILYRGDSDTDEAVESWKRVLDINLDGTYYTTIAFLPSLKRSRGTVINIGSIQSFVSLPTVSAAYGASKGAILMLTRKFASEFAEFGIRVNGIAPGYIETTINSFIHDDPEESARRKARVPLGRFARPDELVGAAVFLSSEQLSSYVNGVMLPVDGGLLAF